MNCTICISEGNMKTMYNDCIIESLEKIKFHYMSLKNKLHEYEQQATKLKEENDKLTKIVSNCEQIEKNESKKRRTASCEDDNDSEISFSQNVAEKNIAQKSTDDLNMALNFDEEFDLSFIPSTQVVIEQKKASSTTTAATPREPLKALPSKTQVENKPLNIKQEMKSQNETSKACNRSISLKQSSSWISKENELKKSVLGSIHKKPSRSLRHFKQEHKSTSLSLKPGKLRQSRLQLDISKNNMSTNFSDTTFCDEAIEASPNADSSLKRINSSKQWTLRNISSKIAKPDDDSFQNFSTASPNKSSASPGSSPQNKSLETSSVVMCTPASQEIIFIDDASESFNIESMDLLKDLMNPTESLSNLKRIESDGIKMLQKINGNPPAQSPIKEKQSLKTVFKPEHEFVKPKSVEKIDSKKALIEDQIKVKEKPISPPKSSYSDGAARAKKFEIDCHECQTYIKYLGERLTDEQIEQHIRNCTKHKKPIDNNLTPDGFWDPMIQQFASDDPRNVTIIDDPFVEDKR